MDSHGKRKLQIKKENLYMLTALWMEQSPWAKKPNDDERVVGAVFVQPDSRVLSVDCSRKNDCGTVHGAIRALIKYPDQVQDCHVYLSRQPCAHCVKMLVQAAVKKVFYLPLKPEKNNIEENKSVDALFKVSPVSREVYVPDISEDDLKELNTANEKNLYGVRELEDNEKIETKAEWNDPWKKKIVEELGWKEYSDGEIQIQVDKNMKTFFEWFYQGILATGEAKEMKWKKISDPEQASTSSEGGERAANSDQVHSQDLDQKVGNHLSRLAQLLSNRTDDPNRGVGCVIALEEEKEIVAIGWNGFPSKALYGNHPRGGDKSNKQKYPHVIHAEQNALMRRNRRNIDDAMAFVNKIPCNECLPLLYDNGVKKLVLSNGAFDKEKENEANFYKELRNPSSKLTVYKQEKN